LITAVSAAQHTNTPYLLLGGGSNVCVSDAGVRGLVIHNACAACKIGQTTTVDTGHSFIELFLKSLKAGLGGLEFAVGIPGTVGGALVSNAGAYRQNICDVVRSLGVVEDGVWKEVQPEWMGFSYRNSRLRQPGTPSAVVVSVTLELEPRPRGEILNNARDNQRQRIFKQPWWPSAGSFFKNVNDKALAEVVPGLTEGMRKAGVVPSGYLSEAVGCKGLAVGGAQISLRHGNFVVNRGNATATDIRQLTAEVKRRVFERFGAQLEEEVLFVGDWSGWEASA
jgi:UDP-N-acetylmuramate dehydrogenase